MLQNNRLGFSTVSRDAKPVEYNTSMSQKNISNVQEIVELNSLYHLWFNTEDRPLRFLLSSYNKRQFFDAVHQYFYSWTELPFTKIQRRGKLQATYTFVLWILLDGSLCSANSSQTNSRLRPTPGPELQALLADQKTIWTTNCWTTNLQPW